MSKEFLQQLLTPVCTQLLKSRAADPEAWRRLVANLGRAGCAEKVRFVQWAKFPLERTPLKLDPVFLLSDDRHLAEAVAVIVDNLAGLLARELSDSSRLVLGQLSADYLERALDELYTSRLTADGIARLMLMDAISADLDEAVARHAGFGSLDSAKKT